MKINENNECSIIRFAYHLYNILYNICTMLDQHQRRWADVVQMWYKCVVFKFGYTPN